MARIIEDSYSRFEVLNRHKTIAMIGLSTNQYRPSHFAAIYMLTHGYTVVPINPRAEEILGHKSYPSLSAYVEESGDVPGIVDMFRKPEDIPPLVDEAIAVGAPVVWMQLGIEHQAAAEKAVRAGIDVIMDRCVKIEHARFFGGLSSIGLNTGFITSKRLPIDL